MFFKASDKKFGTKPASPALQTPQAAMKTAAHDDVNNMLRNLIITVTALRDVLIRENEALEQSNSKAFLDIQDEKVAVARRYETLMTAMLDRKDIGSADPKLKAQLLFLEEGFTTVMKDNLVRLERMKNATERLGERIMKSARKSAESAAQFAYGASGVMQKGVKATMGVSEQA